ncbi:efflux transporter outer membrane subunit [soil metagenome]
MTMTPRFGTLLAMVAAAALAGCASSGASSDASSALASATTQLPPQWQAPLPHTGQLTDLARWWQQFDDPLLSPLIDAAQAASPSIASAASRIEQSRAARVGAGAALLPSLNASASAQRARQDFVTPLGTSSSVGLQAAWELDVFGGARAGRDAAQARLEGAQAGWHDARVAVAAEVATTYVSLRACEAQAEQVHADTNSRAETARLTDLAARAGFQSPGNAALSRASAAQGQVSLTQQRAQCDLLVKSLVALTALPEPALRSQLASGTGRVPQPAQIAIETVPAQALAQRPDLADAARAVLAASADVTQSQAQRYPRITLGGSIAAARYEASSLSGDGMVWSVGPVQLTLPIFDGGTRTANVDAARARFEEAGALYRGQLRNAVREVENALIALQSTADRSTDAQIASDGFAASLRATDSRYRGGLGTLFELEDARRSAVAAQIALIDLQRERVSAWIALYRALGGGWSDAAARTAAR